MSEPILPFTGERFTPECVREILYEHLARYAFALPLARGRRVLDAACGEGYGSAMLAQVADNVLGVDISEDAVAHARARYGGIGRAPRFVRADVTALDPLDGALFDLIVSFETLEHVHEQSRMLAGFARLLSDDGVLLVSSPDKRTYSDERGYRNEYHVRELYRDELETLIAEHFPAHRLFGQKLLFQSATWALDGACAGWCAATSHEDGRTTHGLGYAPLYFIAACARRQDVLDALPSLSLFGDAAESVYAHYDHEVRKNIAAGHRIQELERELAQARAALDAHKD